MELVRTKYKKLPVLRFEEEKEILQEVITKARAGEPVHRQDVIEKVMKFVTSDHRKTKFFTSGEPRDKWFSLFRRRHNHHFLKLDQDTLKVLEEIGFTLKVKNTVSYEKYKKKWRYWSISSTLDRVNLSPSPSPQPESSPIAVAGSPASGRSLNTTGTVNGDTCASQTSHSANDKCETSNQAFVESEKVIAMCPVTVKKVLPNDMYEVMFCDGYTKTLSGYNLLKTTKEHVNNVQPAPTKKPAPPTITAKAPDLGSKEERRLKKCRWDVKEAYQPRTFKRQRVNPRQISTPCTSHTSKVTLETRASSPIKSTKQLEDEEINVENIDGDQNDRGLENSRLVSPKPGPVRDWRTLKMQRRMQFEKARSRARPQEDLERWNVKLPDGVAPIRVKDSDGYCRFSAIVPDKKLPPGWTKHLMPRRDGRKWDVLLVNPKGRRFRGRRELREYFANLKIPFPDENFDFTVIKDKREKVRKQMPCSANSQPAHLTDLRRDEESECSENTVDTPKDDVNSSAANTVPAPPTTPHLELRAPDGRFTCCGKKFRKEKFLQMHMKHYHPERSKSNTANLASTRPLSVVVEDVCRRPKHQCEEEQESYANLDPPEMIDVTLIKGFEEDSIDQRPEEKVDIIVLENTNEKDPLSSVKDETIVDIAADERPTESEEEMEDSEKRDKELTKRKEGHASLYQSRGSSPSETNQAYTRSLGELLEDLRMEVMPLEDETGWKAPADTAPVIKSDQKKNPNLSLKEEPDIIVVENRKNQDPLSSGKDEMILGIPIGEEVPCDTEQRCEGPTTMSKDDQPENCSSSSQRDCEPDVADLVSEDEPEWSALTNTVPSSPSFITIDEDEPLLLGEETDNPDLGSTVAQDPLSSVESEEPTKNLDIFQI